jgi:TonB family protein
MTMPGNTFPKHRNLEFVTPHRYAAIGFVALIHVAVFLLLASGMHVPAQPRNPEDLQVMLFKADTREPAFLPPPPRWTALQAPQEVLVPEPDIEIAPDDQEPGAIAAGVMGQKLAPRLDPEHVNERPPLPASFRVAVGAVSLVLRILVRADGGVAEAAIAKSSGNDDLDRMAANYVTNNWRYLPASVNGLPIEAWTTVVVRFASG